jgi:predicted ArsR family transcriptional regulator
VNVTLSIDEQLVERAREKLRATGKSLNQEIREHLENLVGDQDLERELEEFRLRAGQGRSDPGWKFNRDEIYEERTQWPRE